MNMEQKNLPLSSLCRFSLKEEHLVEDVYVKEEIDKAFNENRCFPFVPSNDLIQAIRNGKTKGELFNELVAIRNIIFNTASDNDFTINNRFLSDVRLSTRIVNAIYHIHRALADESLTRLQGRRFVLVKERRGKPTLYHVSSETTVISHVGQGPFWQEIPSIYLGLNIFDLLKSETKVGENELFDAFKKLLKIEGRAIETGFSHTDVYSPDFYYALHLIVEKLLTITQAVEDRVETELTADELQSTKKFTLKSREKYINLLEARHSHDELNYDYDQCLKGIEGLERNARIAKRKNDRASLYEIVRLLVSTSGHDIHEIRNRANIILERIFAPKDFDAPLAKSFYNLSVGDSYNFSFELPEFDGKYFVRLYTYKKGSSLWVNEDIESVDYPLIYNKEKNQYCVDVPFEEYGHYDYVIHRKKGKKVEWIQQEGCSGRINSMSNLRGELILEIFTDIHGHTGLYWKDENGHPGLVYNENGEVIRLGKFSDITAHLDNMKSRYEITAIYLLGIQKRGMHREDWAGGATSPSPFSPMSLVELEPSLGSEKEFRDLVDKAHSLDIKIIVDIIPHLNRHSQEIPDDWAVKCYADGNLVTRASTDGRFGSWNDGKLLNYRKFEVWNWLVGSVEALIDKYDIDGIRFDSAHAVPVMMKKNNYPFCWGRRRTQEEMFEGNIIVNDRQDDHLVTTGYYDSACRDVLAIPFHYYLMLHIQGKLKEKNKKFFVHLAECYWGHERFLSRTGIVAYNSSLFKICENIIHGKSDVREIYHIYDNYFPSVLPKGSELLGIIGNHDERRALNTFGHRGLRAAVALTIFMSNVVMDYEGGAEGEGWKVFLDNIFVNWNQFEFASNRSLYYFYKEWYHFHTRNKGKGYLIWANNNMVASAMKFTEEAIWIGAFNFSDANQSASMQFDNPELPLNDDFWYKVEDPIYSHITGVYNYYTGRELKVSRLNTMVSYTERVKLIKLAIVEDKSNYYDLFLKDSFLRLCSIDNDNMFKSNFIFNEATIAFKNYSGFVGLIRDRLIPMLWQNKRDKLEIGLKRIIFHLYNNGIMTGETLLGYINKLSEESDERLKKLGDALVWHNQKGALVFMAAEAEPFSKSGGLANVIYELPRELAKAGEEVYVITGLYRNGDEKSSQKMQEAIKQYKVSYSGKNVRFKIMDQDYEIGVHSGMVDGVKYFLLDHHEFFDGLYWGVTSAEKLRRRVAFARACAEVICVFGLNPQFTLTNDAYPGLFNGIVRCDHTYITNPNFARTTFLHIIHNGGWQYFDAFERWENGFDLFNLFNLPGWKAGEFCDPVFGNRLNLMAAGIKFADRTITVSPSYARQIEYASDGLERILKNVIGISNSIGSDFKSRIITRFKKAGFVEQNYLPMLERLKKSPSGSKVAERYPEIFMGLRDIESIKDEKRRYIVTRVLYKMLLQSQRGFEIDPDIVMFTMIHRITDQKGFQLLLESSEGIFKTLGYQAIIGGAVSSGDKRGEEIAHGLYLLGEFYRKQVSVSLSFLDVSIPLLASDVFCMPSMSEPGGISQLEALACGNLVVARATGGLRDTVFPMRGQGDNIEGNGFLFSDYSAWAFYDAMERTNKFFKESNEDQIYQARQNAEKSVYYWDKPAKNYIKEIYRLKEIVRLI